MVKTHKGVYWKLFISTLYLSTFTFGGGYVIVSLMKKQFVDKLGWLDEQEMLNFTAIAQSSPGSVSINASILLGYRVGGIWGVPVAMLGTTLPPMLIIMVVSLFYDAFRQNPVVGAVLLGMQAGIAAVIADVVVGLGTSVLKEKNPISNVVMVLAFVATYWLRVHVTVVIGVCGLIGAVQALARKKKVGGAK